MNNYMCILRSDSGECQEPSPSDMEAMYAKYQAWQDKFANNIADMGNKLSSMAGVVRHDRVDDGPFIELKEVVGGYMMLTASTLEEALTVIKESPMVSRAGTSVEVREIHTR